jgi:DHA2 family multidrug resistance protein-like MFS transporter
MALVLLIGLPTLRESKDPAPGRLDLLSVVLSMVGILGVVYAIKETAIRGFEVGYFAAGVIGVVCLTWFVLRQKRLEHPLLDVRLFASAPFTGAVLATLLSVFGLAGALFFFSQYLQFIKGLEPLQAGLFELPATMAALVAALIAGNIMRRFGRGPVVAVGLLAVGLGMAGVALALDSDQYLFFAVPLILIGAGDGLALTIASDTVLAVAPKDRAGAASAVSETGYELGTALGIALLGSVLTAVYQGTLNLPDGVPERIAAAANESPGEAFEAMAGLPDGLRAALTDAVQVAFSDAMRVTTLAGALVLVLGAVVTWRLLPGRDEAVNEMVQH